MTKVVILGAGNVAFHLFKAFSNAENTKVIQVYNHREESLKYFSKFIETTTEIKDLKPADFYILALKDDVIPEIAQNLKNQEARGKPTRYESENHFSFEASLEAFKSRLSSKNGIVLHTSGAVNLTALSNLSDFGVFYPLQTFSKNKAVNTPGAFNLDYRVDFSEIPVCIEANSVENLEKIRTLASKITKDVREINSEQRKALHLAAVFVNNFSNHLYSIGAEICEEHQVDFSILKPLIKETASKIESLSPKEAQTGPALRNDQKTIEAHLALLSNKDKDIYSLLTQSIQESHGKKL